MFMGALFKNLGALLQPRKSRLSDHVYIIRFETLINFFTIKYLWNLKRISNLTIMCCCCRLSLQRSRGGLSIMNDQFLFYQ